MTGSPSDRQVHAGWEDEGRRIGAELDEVFCALVLGDDPAAAADVALGIGRVQARRRRVVIGDVVGELPPIERYVPEGTVHGVVDAFLFGVSLNRVALPIDPARNLLVLPSGATPLDHDALLRSDRWPRLANGFREVGALLLILAPVDAPSLSAVAAAVDGVVLLGDAAPPVGMRVIARAALPPALEERAGERAATVSPHNPAHPILPPSAADDDAMAAADGEVIPGGAMPGDDGAQPAGPPSPAYIIGRGRRTPDRISAVQSTGRRPSRIWIAAGAAALVLLALATWATQRLLPSRRSARAPAAGIAAVRTDTAAPDAARAPGAHPAASSAAATGEVSVANPADSSSAVPYAVAIRELDNVTFANSQLEQEPMRRLPAVTWSPLSADSGKHTLLVITGAFGDARQADAFLRDLRARRDIKPRQGHVVRTPYALLVQSGVARDQVPVFIDGYRLKGLPVYALLQPDGRANVYAGAFETPDAARTLLMTFRANGETPRVVYRTGRPL